MRIYIELRRDDLIKSKYSTEIEKIELSDFSFKLKSGDLINRATTIVFFDESKVKYFKRHSIFE